MSSLLDFYSSKLFNDINRLAKPLKDHFDIDDFTYLKLTPEGHLSLTGNYAEAKISYISNLCFIKCPLFCHPDNYQNNQYIITSDWSDERFKESQSLNQKKYNLSNFLIICKKDRGLAHLFCYSSSKLGLPLSSVFANNLMAFRSFSDYFYEEWRPHSDKMERYTIDLGKQSRLYFQNPLKTLSETAKSKQEFLQKIGCLPNFQIFQMLTKREIDCAKLLVLGYSCSQIAVMLKLSVRTVEHHVEHIKEKLGSDSKSELVSVLLKYQKYDLI